MRSFGFFLKETISGIKRHSTSSLVTFFQVFVSFLALGFSLVIIVNVNEFIATFLNNLEMGAFLTEDMTEEEKQELKEEIWELPGVRNVEYITKDEAFAIMQERTTMDISDLVNSNPLPASFKITVESPQAAKELSGRIGNMEGIDDVRYGEEQLGSWLPLLYALELIIFFLLIVAAGSTLVTISNTIRLAILARRKDIKIMQLVGATSWFIRIPFMIEGFIYGIGGAALALGLVSLSYDLTLRSIASFHIYNPWMIDYDLMMVNLAIMIFILGGIIGIVASLIAVGRHLQEDLFKPVIQTQGVT